MTSYAPFIICLVIFVISGTFLNWIGTDFETTCEPNLVIEASMLPFSSNWTVLGWDLNPLSYLPPVQDYIVGMYSSFCYLPDFVSVPFFAIYSISFFILLLSIIKDMIPFT